VIRRITPVIPRPINGSATATPIATRGVAEVVDQIGEEGDAAGGDEDRKLSRRRCPEDGERKADRSKPPSRALDAFVDQAVRMAVAILVVR